jgi:hypothetical protein
MRLLERGLPLVAVALGGIIALPFLGVSRAQTGDQQRSETPEIVAPQAKRPDGEEKVYFNLSLPCGADFSPIVLSATEAGTIVARVYHVGSRREIQVLERKDSRWQFLGHNGGAITGVDGNFLAGAKQGPDGRLWVLAVYSFPSNPQRADKIFLYGLQKGVWKLFGPPDGHPVGDLSHGSLHFLGTKPVFQFSDGEQRLVGFEGGRWVGLPAADALLRGGYERICWRQDDAWLFRLSADGGRSILEAYWLKGTLEKTITGPMRLETWPGSVFCWNLAVSADGTIAMLGTVGDPNNHKGAFGRMYRQRRDGVFDASDLPLPTPGLIAHCVEWSPRNVLFAVTTTDSRSLVIHRYEKDRWIASGDVSKPRFFAHDLQLFFGDDGRPIVVYHDFLPAHVRAPM